VQRRVNRDAVYIGDRLNIHPYLSDQILHPVTPPATTMFVDVRKTALPLIYRKLKLHTTKEGNEGTNVLQPSQHSSMCNPQNSVLCHLSHGIMGHGNVL
jgi:hypothetical protein